MKRLMYLLAVCVVFISAGNLFARTWTSPDGKATIELPDDGSLTSVNPLAPGVETWANKDRSSTFYIMVEPETGRKFMPEGFLMGMRSELPGSTFDPVVTRQVNGVTVFSFHYLFADGTTRGRADGWLHNGYRIVLGSVIGEGSPQEQTVGGIFDSLKIVPLGFWQRSEGGVQKSAINGAVVGGLCGAVAGGLAGAIAVIYKMRRKPKSPPLPPATNI